MKKKTIIQSLLIISVLIILNFFFFDFFKKDENKVVLNKIQINETIKDEIKEVKYISKDKRGNSYNITAKKALINDIDTELIKLDNVKAVYNIDQTNKLLLYSDTADYDISDNITNFYNNIKVIYNNELIKCDELQLNLLEDYIILKENIIYESEKIKLMADHLKIDLLENTSFMSMFNEIDKIKIIKKNVNY